MNKLLTASEIAALKLPFLPTTNVAIRSMAEREKWHFEERKGLGGTRRVYEVPVKYYPRASAPHLGADATAESGNSPSQAPSNVIGTIAAGSSKVDVEKLALAMRTLDEWEKERGLRIKPERRPAVISLLYDFLERNEGKNMETLFQALG